jgi:hypothetical protein
MYHRTASFVPEEFSSGLTHSTSIRYMRHQCSLPSMAGGHRRAVNKKAIVIQCIDCKIVIGTEAGSTPKTEIQWSLCSRCVARRNGMMGAKTPNELGIY